jgi:exoribonuclease R
MSGNTVSEASRATNNHWVDDIPASRETDEMRTYIGARTIDGIKVTVDDKPLDERIDIHLFSDNGFEWTYEGDAPQQLALAILAEHLGDDNRALELSGRFMRQVIAELDNEWVLTDAEINAELLSG